MQGQSPPLQKKKNMRKEGQLNKEVLYKKSKTAGEINITSCKRERKAEKNNLENEVKQLKESAVIASAHTVPFKV